MLEHKISLKVLKIFTQECSVMTLSCFFYGRVKFAVERVHGFYKRFGAKVNNCSYIGEHKNIFFCMWMCVPLQINKECVKKYA